MNALVPLKDEPPLVALDLEQQVLGGILANNAAFQRVQAFLQPEHFGDARHAEIYACIKAMIEAGKPATPPMLVSYLDATGALAKVGGSSYLAKIISGLASPQFTEDYARALLDLWARRQAVIIIDEAATRLRRADLSDPAADQLAQAASMLDELGALGTAPSVVPVGEAAASVVESVRDIVEHGVVPKLVPTGFKEIDRVIGGLEAGNLMILAARPSAGKTSLAQWMAYNAARGGYGVGFFSIEMNNEELTRRWISGLSGVPANAMKTGKVWEQRYGQRTERPISREEMARIIDANEQIKTLAIHLDANSSPTPADIVAGVRKMRRERRAVDLVVVDYLGLVRPEKPTGRTYDDVSANVIAIKSAAKKLQVPVILLAQLSRANESRDDKRPGLSDIRDSGKIEETGDIIAMLHREHYYLARQTPQQRAGESAEDFDLRQHAHQAQCREHEGKAEVAIIKSRNGSVETVRIAFEDRTTRFVDLDEDERGGHE